MIVLAVIICYQFEAGPSCMKVPLPTPPQINSCDIDLTQEAHELRHLLRSYGEPVSAVFFACKEEADV